MSVSQSLPLALLLVLPAHVDAYAQSSFEKSQTAVLLNAAKQSRDENASNLRTAVGEGSLRHSLFERDQLSPIVIIDADFQLFYEAPKFNLRLQYASRLTEVAADVRDAGEAAWTDSGLAEQLILFDGASIYSIEVSQTGEYKGDVYFDFKRHNILRAAGFPFENPVELWEAFKIERAELTAATITPLSTGGFLGVLNQDTYRLKFYFFGDFGYDLRRFSSYRVHEDIPFRDCLLSWQQSNGIYYTQRFVSRLDEATSDAHDSQGPSVLRRQLEVDYHKFEANLPIDEKWFTLSSLAIPIQTRFHDHRANVGGKPRVHQFDGMQLVEITQ